MIALTAGISPVASNKCTLTLTILPDFGDGMKMHLLGHGESHQFSSLIQGRYTSDGTL